VDLDNMEIVNFKVFGEKVAATIPRRQYTSAFSRITPLLNDKLAFHSERIVDYTVAMCA
jgi:hypothetical protein